MTEDDRHSIGTSRDLNKKIEVLQIYLLEEKELTSDLKKEIDHLKKELKNTKQSLRRCDLEEKLLTNKIDYLTSTLKNHRMEKEDDCSDCSTVESVVEADESCCKAKDIYLNDENTSTSTLNEMDTKLLELEEEVRLLKERYDESNLENMNLNKSLEELRQKQDSAGDSSSSTSVLLYVIPLLIVIAGLLGKMLFT